MGEQEKYYFTFQYVDGSTETFEQDRDTLAAKIRNGAKSKILVNNTIINLDNVIKVKVETETQRREQKEIQEQKNRESIEIIRQFKP